MAKGCRCSRLVRLAVLCCLAASAAPLPGRFEFTCVDGAAIAYATFQSTNQKVVSSPGGIFMAYNQTRNEAYTSQRWRLLRSTDGGTSFSTVYEATHATHPPMIEADSAGDVYLVHMDGQAGDARFYRFRAADNYARPAVAVIPGGDSGKYAMFLDESQRRLFYFANNNRLYTLGLDGGVLSSTLLLRPGPHAMLMYPLLSMGGAPAPGASRDLFAAWTTQKHGIYMYRDIHAMKSPDGGATWRSLGGRPLTLPVVADETGPAERITLDDEFEYHTWLSSFAWKGRKLHFCYEAQTTSPREHYVRYDADTGRRELDVQPRFAGQTISILGLDGFFCSAGDAPGDELFFVGHAAGRLGCLVSRDNGTTWHDFAISDLRCSPYSIGGCRRVVTINGRRHIIGSFTDQSGGTAIAEGRSKVYFFKIALP
jgi:hypothetical protein